MSEQKKEILITKKLNDHEVFEGHVKMAALSYHERIEQSKLGIADMAEENASLEVRANDNLKRSKNYYDLALSRIREVSVKIRETGEEITDLDSLMIYEEGTQLVMILAQDLIAGVTLGKIKPQV